MLRTEGARGADAVTLVAGAALPTMLLAVVAVLPRVGLTDSDVAWVVPSAAAVLAAIATLLAVAALVGGMRRGSIAALAGVGAAGAVGGGSLALALTGRLEPVAVALPVAAALGLVAMVAHARRRALPGRGRRSIAAAGGLLLAEAAVIAGLLPVTAEIVAPQMAPLFGLGAVGLVLVALVAHDRWQAITATSAAIGAAGFALDRAGSLELLIGLAAMTGAGAFGLRALIGADRGRTSSIGDPTDALPSLAQHLPDGVLRFDGRLTLTDWNPAAARLLALADDASGTRLDDLLGVTLAELPADDRPRTVETPLGGLEIRIHRDGEGLVVLIAAKPDMPGEDRLGRELRGTIEELLQARRTIELQRAELERLSTVDPLTGVASRSAVLERLRTEIAQARRYQHPVAVLLLDLDGFDAVNRRHGVAGGDALLREVALRMRLRVRESDALGRAGSDGFLAILPHTDEGGAATFAEALRQRLAQRPLAIGDELVRVTASVGVAVMRRADDLDLDGLLARVTEALESARAAGGDRIALDRLHGLARLERHRAHDRGEPNEGTR